MKNGRRLSILGDSISTYRGVSNDGEANRSTCCNPFFYREPFPLNKTYWMLVLEELALELCVNNSWSGGTLSGRDDPDSGVCRASRLSRDNGVSPDVIIVFMGINDLGRGVSPSVFASDYTFALLSIKEKHPSAQVCCVNLPDRDPLLRERTEIFNQAIENAVRNAGSGFFVADLFGSRLNNDDYYMNTVDGLHPDEDGMRIIAEVIGNAIKENAHLF